MIMLAAIINLYKNITSETKSNSLRIVQEPQNSFLILDHILLDKTAGPKKSIDFYDICNKIFIKLNENIKHSLKINFNNLRDNLLENITILDLCQEEYLRGIVTNILDELCKFSKIYESSLDDKINIIITFLNFNLQKNLIKRLVYEHLQVQKDKKSRLLKNTFNDREENHLNVKKKDDINDEKEVFYVKDKNNVVNKKESMFNEQEKIKIPKEFDCNSFSEKENLLNIKYQYVTEEEINIISKEEKSLIVTDNFGIRVLVNDDNAIIENENFLTMGRKELQKILDDAKLSIYEILQNYKKFLIIYIDRNIEMINSLNNYKALRRHFKECKIAKKFVDDTFVNVKCDVSKIVDLYMEEFMNHLIN